MTNIGIECESIEGSESWGVGRIVKNLLQEISRRSELASEFRFFLYFKSGIPDLEFLNNPIFVKKNIGPSSFSLYYYVFLPVKLWFEGLDLMFFPNYMLPLIFRGRSLVMLTEDIHYEIAAGTLPLRYKLAYKIFAGWWAACHATKIMAISETSKKEVARLFKINPDRITANPLGVDPPQKIPDTRPEARSTSYILYIGQAFPRRHLRETLLAFELLSPQFPDLKLIAVGKDKYNPPVIEKLKNDINTRLGRNAIIHKEYVSEKELGELYAGARVAIYVSSKEAFGLPPLEALGYGVPAVVADQPVTREIFGSHAFFARPELVEGLETYTPKSIAAAMAEGLTDETKRQEIKNAREGILAKYTWQKHADRFLQIITRP